jgi:hypothetical protein
MGRIPGKVTVAWWQADTCVPQLKHLSSRWWGGASWSTWLSMYADVFAWPIGSTPEVEGGEYLSGNEAGPWARFRRDMAGRSLTPSKKYKDE